MIKEIREILKLDKITAFVILFWSAIFSITAYIFYALALPQVVRILLVACALNYLVLWLLESSFGEIKLSKAIFKQTMFFLMGPIISFIGIGGMSDLTPYFVPTEMLVQPVLKINQSLPSEHIQMV